MTQTISEVEVLRRDVHPAEISLPDGSIILGARAFITSHRLLAYRVEAGRIEKALELELSDPFSVPADRGTLRNGQLECVTAMGTVWVNRGHGCGCGSPLKALAAPVSWTGR